MGLFRERLRVKVCRSCLRVKVIGNFYKNRSSKDGLDAYCKSCRLEYNAIWCASNKQKRYLIQWRYRNKQWI